MKKNILFLKITLSLLVVLIFSAQCLADNKLELKIHSAKKEYIEGEALSISLETSEDCNVLLLYITASGETIRILPSGTAAGGKVKGKKIYTTPGDGEDRGLYIAEPFGKERIVAYATFEKIPPIAGEKIGEGIYLVPGGQEYIRKLLPDAVKAVWDLETFPRDERSRFRKSEPESPIHMTGSAGQSKKIKDEGIQQP